MTGARARRSGTTTAIRSVPARVLGAVFLLAGCTSDADRSAGFDTALPAPAGATIAPDSVAAASVAPVADSAPTPPAVSAFLQHVETQRTPDSAGVRAYAADGLRLLATAIEELAARDTAVAARLGARLGALRARADSVQREPDPLVRARIASESFVLAGDLLQTLRQGSPPALTDRAAEVRQAAAAVRSDQALSAQEDAVRRFFERSAAALRGFTGARTS